MGGYMYLLLLLLSVTSPAVPMGDLSWLTRENEGFTSHFTEDEKNDIEGYEALIFRGIDSVKDFFGKPFRSRFDVYFYENRRMLDSAWSRDWGMPGFTSECWMVASGIAARMDVIAPKTWKTQSCEHDYTDTTATRRLLTHELVHVYHGQLNISPDFSNTEQMDWFVEGLAAYASGQLDENRWAAVRKAVAANAIPNTLDSFWTGALKYPLSASVVRYIDERYGRKQLVELLRFNTKSQLLSALHVSEKALLEDWKKMFR